MDRKIFTLLLEVHNNITFFNGDPIAIKAVMEQLSILDPKRFVKPSFKRRVWDGYFRLYDTMTKSFPTGLLTYVISKIDKLVNMDERKFYRVEYKIDDKRGQIFPKNKDWSLPDFEFRDYQEEAIKSVFNPDVKGRGVIHAATNAGKTEILIGLAKYIGRKTLYIAPNHDPLAIQAYERFEKRGVKDISLYHWKESELEAQIVISNIQFLYARKDRIMDFLKSVELILIDEVQLAQAKTYKEIINFCENAYYRIGFSGTPFSGVVYNDLLMMGSVGPVIYKIKNEELINKGFSSKPKILCVHYTKDEGNDLADYDDVSYKECYSEFIVFNNKRNKAIIDIVCKINAKGDKSIVFVSQLAHCKILSDALKQSGVPTEVVTGEVTDREQIKSLFEQYHVKCLVVTTVFDIGVDFAGGVDCLVMAAGGISQIRSLQRIGRGLRMQNNKWNKCLVFDFQDEGKYVKRHSHTRFETYKSENFDCKSLDFTEVDLELETYYKEKENAKNG